LPAAAIPTFDVAPAAVLTDVVTARDAETDALVAADVAEFKLAVAAREALAAARAALDEALIAVVADVVAARDAAADALVAAEAAPKTWADAM
jgi:hypothetical protein